MPLASPCSNSATYGASFSQESARSYMGASPGASLPLCQNGSGKRRKSRKSRKKTKRKKKAGAVAAVAAATVLYYAVTVYRAASAFVSMYNTLKKPDEPLTVTQAAADYIKGQGRELMSRIIGSDLNYEEQMKLANGYKAYIKRHPEKILVKVEPDEKFGGDEEEEGLYADVRADAGKKGRASYKPKRGKKSRRKSRRKSLRKKRSQRGGTDLGLLGLPPPGRGPKPQGKGKGTGGDPPSEKVTPNKPRHEKRPQRPEQRWICNSKTHKCERAAKGNDGYPNPKECKDKTECDSHVEEPPR